MSASSNDATPASEAVDMIRQNQQGFAKLEADAKTKADATGDRARTEKATKSGPVASTSNDAAKRDAFTAVALDKTSPTDTRDAETKANIDRVTAFYLDDDAPEKSVKHVA